MCHTIADCASWPATLTRAIWFHPRTRFKLNTEESRAGIPLSLPLTLLQIIGLDGSQAMAYGKHPYYHSAFEEQHEDYREHIERETQSYLRRRERREALKRRVIRTK